MSVATTIPRTKRIDEQSVRKTKKYLIARLSRTVRAFMFRGPLDRERIHTAREAGRRTRKRGEALIIYNQSQAPAELHSHAP